MYFNISTWCGFVWSNYDNTKGSPALVWHKTETRIIPVELSSQSVLLPKQQLLIYFIYFLFLQFAVSSLLLLARIEHHYLSS